jgi:hypothetical protein
LCVDETDEGRRKKGAERASQPEAGNTGIVFTFFFRQSFQFTRGTEKYLLYVHWFGKTSRQIIRVLSSSGSLIHSSPLFFTVFLHEGYFTAL